VDDKKIDYATAETQALVGKSIWIFLALIFIIWAAYWRWVVPAQGSQFEPLATLFSGLAFWGVIYAILLQKSELELQRQELKLTRGEVRGQKEQLAAQNATLKQQKFENTFFSLLNLYISVVDSIEIRLPQLDRARDRDVITKGRNCFSQFLADFKREYTGEKKRTPDVGYSELCISAYDRFANYRQTDVGHYFRTMYNIIKFVENSQIKDKQTYVNILRAQLSSDELGLLFYNCLSRYGIEKFKPYVEKFGLLENMTPLTLLDSAHKDLYQESAFKNMS
jgi:hypothetical protein